MLGASMTENSFKKGSGDVALDQTHAILSENSSVPNLVIHAQTNKPSEQQVVIQLFHEKALTANAVKDRKEKCAQEFLGRNIRPARLRVQVFKLRRHLLENHINHGTDSSKGMILGNSLFAEILRKIHSCCSSVPYIYFLLVI
jgi:hypothetical protein